MKKVAFAVVATALSVAALSACEEEQPYAAAVPSEAGPIPLKTSWGAAGGGAAEIDVARMTARNFYVVVDGSGSMQDAECSDGMPKIDAAKAALARFVDQIPDDANIGMTAFDARGVGERVSIGPASTVRPTFLEAVAALQADGGTPLGATLAEARRELAEQAARQSGYGEYVVVVVTDGAASDPAILVNEVRGLIDDTPVQIHTIGFCIAGDHILNMPGDTAYVGATSADMLSDGLAAVLAETEAFAPAAFGE